MIQLATPISSLFEDSAAAEEIVAASDCLECRDHSPANNFSGRYLLHLNAQIFHPWGREIQARIQSRILGLPELKLVSFHMGCCFTEPGLANGVYQPQGKALSREELNLSARKNIAWLRRCFPAQLQIGVENNNYYPNPAYQTVTDGNFISDLVRENGVTLVFDLAHALITSHNMRLPYDDYIASLPLEFAVQMHLGKYLVREDGLAFDAHELPDDEVFHLAERTLKRFPFQYLTIEYYQNARKLVDKLREARSMLESWKHE